MLGIPVQRAENAKEGVNKHKGNTDNTGHGNGKRQRIAMWEVLLARVAGEVGALERLGQGL